MEVEQNAHDGRQDRKPSDLRNSADAHNVERGDTPKDRGVWPFVCIPIQ
jgi:hypothetical protein